jgi:hypothetical protein
MQLDDDDLIAALDEIKNTLHARAMETFTGDIAEKSFVHWSTVANKVATLRNKLYTGTVVELKRERS